MNLTVLPAETMTMIGQAKKATLKYASVKDAKRKAAALMTSACAGAGASASMYAGLSGNTNSPVLEAMLHGFNFLLFNILIGMCYKPLVTALKEKKQALQALKQFANDKVFLDIVNHDLRINGEEKITSKQLLRKLKKGENSIEIFKDIDVKI